MSHRKTWMWQHTIAWATEHGMRDACLFRPGFEYRWTVQLPDGSQPKAYAVVCAHFHGPQPTDMEVAHACRGGDRGCFAPAHVRWDTRRGNQRDRITDGTQASPAGWRQPVLAEASVNAIRARLNAGERGVDLAAEFGVARSTISMIRRRRNWAWLHEAEG